MEASNDATLPEDFDQVDETRRPRTVEEVIALLPPEVFSLRTAVKARGALALGNTLGELVRNYVESDGSDIDPLLCDLLGQDTSRHLDECRVSVKREQALRQNLASQLGRLVESTIQKCRAGCPLEVEVGQGATGFLQVQFQHNGTTKVLPLSQLQRFFDWGTVPYARDEAAAMLLELKKVSSIKNLIGRIVSSMRQIAKSQAYRALGPDLDVASWVEASGGATLELFMRDVIGRSGLECRRAPVFEDILEATDLRVTLPGILRRHGVRIQVSWVSDYERFSRKRHLIPYAPTVVFLCPFSLAQSGRWDREAVVANESDEPVTTAWYAKSERRLQDEEVARFIQNRVSMVIRQEPRHPLGPAETAPFDLIELIGSFVRKEGLRCHHLLRAKQERRPNYGRWSELVRDRILDELRRSNPAERD